MEIILAHFKAFLMCNWMTYQLWCYLLWLGTYG